MRDYFGVPLEFSHSRLFETVETAVESGRVGYVCFVDANVLAMSNASTAYSKVLRGALVNSCDGSSIALLAGWIHREGFTALNGPEVFERLILVEGVHVLVGGEPEALSRVATSARASSAGVIKTLPLPFATVEDFDYARIADSLSQMEAEYIWVSLGAPKQERFMALLSPKLDSGVMFGIGAAFAFFLGDVERPQSGIGRLRFIWLFRLLKEPRKIGRRLGRYALALPRLIYREVKSR